MKNDDELVKRIVAGIQAMPLRGGKYTDLEDVARAAIAVMREAGWKGPDEIKTAEGLAALAAVDGPDL